MMETQHKEFLCPNYKAKPINNYKHQCSIIKLGSMKRGKLSRGQFSEDELSVRINVLEIRALQFGLTTLYHDVLRTHVLVKIDNTLAVAIINKVSSIKSV